MIESSSEDFIIAVNVFAPTLTLSPSLINAKKSSCVIFPAAASVVLSKVYCLDPMLIVVVPATPPATAALISSYVFGVSAVTVFVVPPTVTVSPAFIPFCHAVIPVASAIDTSFFPRSSTTDVPTNLVLAFDTIVHPSLR